MANMDKFAQQIHDARRPLNNISMQAELIKMLAESNEQATDILAAADKIIQYCQQCSEQLQTMQKHR
ncbi:histidine kinase [Ningiella sp. W23]|uniref:histidine kinase n=1 Tax=Ningiella sp. W23 TaxID=3023715 RepID=UPI003757FDE6